LGWYESVSSGLLGRRAKPVEEGLTICQKYRQPILADEVQTFKALITIHKVLQEGHPVVLKEAQANAGWLDSLKRGVVHGDGVRG
jgi:ANTH domain